MVSRVAWITGGARMGFEIAQALSDRDYAIVLTWNRSKARAEQDINRLKALGRAGIALRCDVAADDSIAEAVKAVEKQFGRLDLLINMASVYDLGGLMSPNGVKYLEAHMAAEADSTFRLSRACAPIMGTSELGHMIHFSDWTPASGRPRYRDYGPYYIAKATVKAMVECLALELAPKIVVNAIAPGPILPPADLPADEYEAVVKSTPMGRWGGISAIVKTILFLAETDFITGETIRVDGGRHLY